jgi:RNA polymerase sigma-70 factor (ECF subfamily)
LVQETMIAAHRSFRGFQGQTEPELAAWIRSILAHVSANAVRHYRRQKRDVRLERQLQQEFDDSSQMLDQSMVPRTTQSSPSQRLIRRENAVLMAQALDQLAADYREVLVLRELQGLKIVDIAKRLGRSEDSVQKLWARAVMQMRHLMEGVR